jgi:hypothetical protein
MNEETLAHWGAVAPNERKRGSRNEIFYFGKKDFQ